MLKDNTVAIYIIVDDILKKIDYKEDSQRRVTDALVLFDFSKCTKNIQ